MSEQSRPEAIVQPYGRDAVAFGDLKNAALYYDHLVPVFVGLEFARKQEWPHFLHHVAGELFPPQLATYEVAERLAELNGKTFNVLRKLVAREYGYEESLSGLTASEYDAVEREAAQAYFQFIADFGLSQWPLAAEDGPATAGMPNGGPESTSPILLLGSLSVVDASKVPWEQIMELRRDKVSMQKMRRLRLFAYENYSGKTADFVRDDLLSRIYDYEQVTRRWALDTVQGSIGAALDSKYVIASASGVLVSVLFGEPLAALASGVGGAALEVGQFVLRLKQRRLALQELADQNPISYVSYLQEKLVERDP